MTELVDIFNRGGPLMWPILLASVVALAVAIERALVLRRGKVIPETTVRQVLQLVGEGKITESREVCRHDGGSFARIARAGLDWWDHGPEAVREAIEDAGRREAPKLMRALGVVGTVASISPLLGLLGTVVGMIQVFATISVTGPGQGQGLSAGISEALLTTAFGLSVAIPALIIYNMLTSRAERLILDIEGACHDMLRFHPVEVERGREAHGAEETVRARA
jgi:biopolymer transport protein ExbB